MTAGKRVVFTLLLLVFGLPLLAQKPNKAQLQREKQENLQKIKEVEKILTETSTKKKNSLGELSAINQRIVEQEKLIRSIKSEIELLEEDIDENNEFIVALEEDLKKLKEEYAAMLFAAQKAHNSATRLTFIFSASSFDQLVMRLRYMRQYSERRRLQAEAIVKVQDELTGQIRQIENKKTEKRQLLDNQIAENTQLANLKKKQNTIVKALTKEEKSLKKDLEETKKALAVLDKKINDIIREEIERAEREARASATNKTSASVNSANIALSSNFELNKNKFPWPTSGFISQKFGRQNHPVLKGIVVQNFGINIQTKENEKVRTIFEGEVREIAFVPRFGNTVIISHGSYFTVYSGLKEVTVKKGQKVVSSQEIGQVLSNADGISELRFQIYKNTTAVDPEIWLRN
jgi:septal ring factor EnvC (AmiA/AmiB activator)